MDKKNMDNDIVDVEEKMDNERNNRRKEKKKRRVEEINDQNKVKVGNEKASCSQVHAAKMSSVKAGSVAGDRVKSPSRKSTNLPPLPATYTAPPVKGRQVVLSDNVNEYAEILDTGKAHSRV